MGPPLVVMVLVGLLRWHDYMLRELPSGELLYRSYRLHQASIRNTSRAIYSKENLANDPTEFIENSKLAQENAPQ
jgi:hypothetical protein